jgi:hypothetical protein
VTSPEKRRAALGGLAILAGFALGAIDRRNQTALGHTAVDVVGLLAWALIIGGVLVAAFAVAEYRVNCVPDTAPLPAPPNWRWRLWNAATVVFAAVFLVLVAALVSEIVKRVEGDARPRVGAILITVVFAVIAAALARGFRRAGRRARSRMDGAAGTAESA